MKYNNRVFQHRQNQRPLTTPKYLSHSLFAPILEVNTIQDDAL